MSRTPVFFISHGAPTWAIEPGQLGPQIEKLGRELDGVRAVLVVSPHWQTPDLRVMAAAQPETIHDFGGFPDALYRLQYTAPGAPELAQTVAQRLTDAGFPVSIDAQRGRDHGAWVPMMYLLPEARLPVFQVSMPRQLDTRSAYALGRALSSLRDEGVLIVASGSMTHNLYEFRGNPQPAPYVLDFVRWVREAVTARDDASLADYRQLAPQAERAHPTEEHFLPLLVAAGAAAANDVVQPVDGGVTYGILSMDSYVWRPAA
ncbi:dioxygenase family protein [Solimonas marina]|uniref:Dioxygenase n=1 Tax=Solimonas marina TaxID=2714601 RepID=A0A970B7Z1_9GAMM|nr:class III extradiol ring-cleavage dioxygenase [Solimonas marina]NKF20901.1 dioxygenase [Solimonas marina]